MKNDVWEIVPKARDKSFVTSKWVYNIKYAIDGSIDKYKATFIARGFSQKELTMKKLFLQQLGI